MRTLLVALLGIVTGCAEFAADPSQPSLEGLTLADLRPADLPEAEVKSVITVLAYQVPFEKAKLLPEKLSMLSQEGIEYADKEGFEANALWAAQGDKEQMQEVAAQLVQFEVDALLAAVKDKTQAQEVVARHVQLGEFAGRNSYLLFDETPEAFAGFPLDYGQTLSFYRADKTPASRVVSAGSFTWSFRLRKEASSVRLTVAPAFESYLGKQLKQAGRPAGDMEFTVEEASLQADLQEGDFLVLAVTEDQRAANSLHWFFQSPVVREGSVLVYLILYADAGNA